jgi:hypothetical protein
MPWQVMMTKISVLRVGLTGLAGIIGAGIAVVTVGALIALPLPTISATAPSFTVQPTSGSQQRVCAGPLLQVMSQKGNAVAYYSNGRPDVVSFSQGATAEVAKLAVPDNQAAGSLGSPTVYSAPIVNDGSLVALAASQGQKAVGESLSGYAADACAEPSNDSWLVGGSTEVGRTTLLLLSNPTSVTASVAVEVFGEQGLVGASVSKGVFVEAGEQRILSLAGLAPDVIAPVVHVTSTGGKVLASLQHSVMRTLTPAGIEVVNASAIPATTQIMTGVVLTGQQVSAGSEHGAVTSDLESAVRVLVPGTVSATVRVRVIPVSGTATEIESTVSGQTVVQFPFAGIVDGTYAVEVTSDQPIVAGVRTVQSSASGGDFTWVSSVAPGGDTVVVPVPVGPAPVLSLFNSGEEPVVATLRTGDTAPVTVRVAAGALVTRPLVAGAVYTLEGAGGLLGGVTFSGSGVGSAIALQPANQMSAPVTVYPR